MPTSQSIFQVFDPALTGIMPDVFGVWDTAPMPVASAVSFDVNAAPHSTLAAPIPVWRATFPTDPHEAETLLNAQQARLQHVRQEMPRIVTRFEALTTSRAEELSFAAPSQQTVLTAPEQELAAFLTALQPGDSQVSFGLDWKNVGMLKEWPTVVARFQTFLQQATRTISYAAWVETYLEQTCLARTSVGWGGDTQTIWQQTLNAEHRALHGQNLSLALTSRQELITLVTLAVQTALRLAALLNMPGNVIKILPAVWTCLQQLLEQVDVN